MNKKAEEETHESKTEEVTKSGGQKGDTPSLFTKVLVATDLSSTSLAAAECLKTLRAMGTRECVLVHCCDIRERVPFPDQVKEYLEGTLNEYKEVLGKQGFDASIKVVPGLPKTEIPRVAAKEDCSLIVIGSHGHNLGSEILLGGVASAVIHQASRPVLVLRMETDSSGKPQCISGACDFLGRVLFPTDFSDNAEHAFAWLRDMVRSGARHVTLLHIQDETKIGKHLEHRLDEFNELDRERLEGLKAELEEIGDVDVEIEISYGVPKADITEHARRDRYDLVIMGTHGRGFVSELFLGSVSHNVARHAEAPVLLIPAPETAGESS